MMPTPAISGHNPETLTKPTQQKTMEHYLNIGLHRAKGGKVTKGELLAALRLCRIVKRGAIQYHESDTETTAVLELDKMPTVERLHTLSETLGQDAIALYSLPAKRGTLIGPNAAKWGKFNPAYFLLPSGGRAFHRHLTR